MVVTVTERYTDSRSADVDVISDLSDVEKWQFDLHVNVTE